MIKWYLEGGSFRDAGKTKLDTLLPLPLPYPTLASPTLPPYSYSDSYSSTADTPLAFGIIAGDGSLAGDTDSAGNVRSMYLKLQI